MVTATKKDFGSLLWKIVKKLFAEPHDFIWAIKYLKD